MRRTLALRLLVAFLSPTLVLLAAFGVIAYRVTEVRLERALGHRLMGIAGAAATQIRPESIQFLNPGDDLTRTAGRLKQKLQALKERTALRRLFILDPALKGRGDTQDSAKIGDRYYQVEADRSELDRVFKGETASSVLFRGDDGRYYKRGYAPIFADENVIAALAVEGSAEFFEDLSRLGNYFIVSGAVVALLVTILCLFVARRITRPLRLLASEADRIGKGDLDSPIELSSNTEVGLLAKTMNTMRVQLLQRDQQRQMMLSGIAHEVRNPLGGIALFTGLLRDELKDQPDQRSMVERIERELDYLNNVVEDFLDFARQPAPKLGALDLHTLLGEISDVAVAQAQAAEVSVEKRLAPTVVLGDREQLRRVLLNLTQNAIQATEAGGKVVLSCGTADDLPFFEVRDSGKGIEKELLEKVFTPFFTTREKGTGLGLALSKKIIDEHHGSIKVDSTPNVGTTIRVFLRPA